MLIVFITGEGGGGREGRGREGEVIVMKARCMGGWNLKVMLNKSPQ